MTAYEVRPGVPLMLEGVCRVEVGAIQTGTAVVVWRERVPGTSSPVETATRLVRKVVRTERVDPRVGAVADGFVATPNCDGTMTVQWIADESR